MNRIIPVLVVALGLAACGESSSSTTTTTPAPSTTPTATTTTTESVTHPNHSANADNSAVNKGDSHDALTPLSQGSSTADIQETASVRKAIMAASGMSMDAQNIKIITIKGTLTLRGTVDSKAEHDRVCQLAKNAIGSPVFDDQLNIKTTP